MATKAQETAVYLQFQAQLPHALLRGRFPNFGNGSVEGVLPLRVLEEQANAGHGKKDRHGGANAPEEAALHGRYASAERVRKAPFPQEGPAETAAPRAIVPVQIGVQALTIFDFFPQLFLPLPLVSSFAPRSTPALVQRKPGNGKGNEKNH